MESSRQDKAARSDAVDRRTCLLVLGAHRSGTSALARVASLLGAELPKNLLEGGHGNEAGHWEPAHLFRLHDHMLEEGGSRWDDWRRFDASALPPDRLEYYRGEIKNLLLAEYDEAPLFVVKEPRVCRFVWLYADVLGDLGLEIRCILPYRNPLAVVASHLARDGMTPGFVGFLWLRHVLDAESATRGLQRAFVRYEALLDDWRKESERVSTALSLSWPHSLEKAAPWIDGYLTRDLQHHAPTSADLENADINEWIKAAYHALVRLTDQDDDTEALAALDQVRADFEAASEAFGEAAFPEIAVRERRLTEAQKHLASLCEQQKAEIEHLSTENRLAQDRTRELVHQLEELRGQQSSTSSVQN